MLGIDAPVAGKITGTSGPDRFHRAKMSLMNMPDGIEKKLQDLYKFDSIDFTRGGFRWSASESRVYCPIYSLQRHTIGGVYRTLNPEVKPKSYIVQDRTDFPKMSCYPNSAQPFKKILIVEDQFSAVASVFEDITGVALLGCNTNIDAMRQLSDKRPDHVIFCLDKDALKNSIALHKRYGDFFPKCSVASPPCDIKDMTRDERAQFIRRCFAE